MSATEIATATEGKTPSETVICPVSTYQPNYARNASIGGEDDKDNETVSIRNKKNMAGDCNLHFSVQFFCQSNMFSVFMSDPPISRYLWRGVIVIGGGGRK